MPESIESLTLFVERINSRPAIWVESVVVKTVVNERPWEGTVHVFDVVGKDHTTRCYAWAVKSKESRWSFHVVNHGNHIDSPHAAVRSSGSHDS